MPKTWIYAFALLLPLILRVLLLNTGFVDWLWGQQYLGVHRFFNALRGNALFLRFIADWAYPVFVFTVIAWHFTDETEGDVTRQFLLLPILYVPFTIVADILLTGQVDLTNLVTHPLIILPLGYVYILGWGLIAWVFEKMNLTV